MHPFTDDQLRHIDLLLALAIAEDIGAGDVTSAAIFPPEKTAAVKIIAREKMVVCGLPVVERLTQLAPSSLLLKAHTQEGELCEAGESMATLTGTARDVLAIERTLLNLLQRMCGIATRTAEYVQAVKHTNARILDTRKTMPGMRVLDKYAVRTGGGDNHRFGLYDMVMIKDNHIALAGGLKQAVDKVLPLKARGLLIEVECDTLEQVQEALKLPIDRILLDNMSSDQLKKAVKLSGGKIPLEASGGITLQTAATTAETGVDFLSVGELTHSVRAADIGMDISYE